MGDHGEKPGGGGGRCDDDVAAVDEGWSWLRGEPVPEPDLVRHLISRSAAKILGWNRCEIPRVLAIDSFFARRA